jgi:holo-[acyl-carrier protein] synthase
MSISNITIGVDIEQVSRFNDLDRTTNHKFLTKIFTSNEMDYCFSKREPAQHLAVRFVAKEAIIKAISSFGDKAPTLGEIDIEKNDFGVPSVNLAGYEVKLSLSHCKDKAMAFVILAKVLE